MSQWQALSRPKKEKRRTLDPMFEVILGEWDRCRTSGHRLACLIAHLLLKEYTKTIRKIRNMAIGSASGWQSCAGEAQV